jgi:hypothetical protein
MLTLVNEPKKLSIPPFDPSKMSWNNFAMKLHAALIDLMIKLLDRKGLRCVAEALAFVESPTKVDNFFWRI